MGHVCVPALHAAALEPQLFGSVKLVRGLVSWSNVIELAQSRNQLVNTVHGALTTYDLPDLVRTLGDRVTIEQPLNALGEPVETRASAIEGSPAILAWQSPVSAPGATADGVILKDVLGSSDAGENLLRDDAWRAFGRGFKEEDGVFTCDNGSDAKVQRGVSQTVTLNQTRPEPIVATAWSQARNVGGSRDSDYSLYLDLVYQDGSTLWGQVDAFNAGSHDWEKAQVTVFPEKPVKSVTVNLLLRNHAGMAQFHAAELRPIRPPMGACLFDGIAVSQQAQPREGFQVRDVAAGSGFVGIEGSALDLKLECKTTKAQDATFFDVTVSDTSGKDRAVTLIYAVPVSAQQCRWFQDPRETREVEPGREYLNAGRFAAGSNGRLSRYPFAAVANARQAVALGIDMAQPAFFRVGYNAGTQELFLAYDLGLTPEKPTAHLRFCKFPFDSQGEFRAALARYYDLFPQKLRAPHAEQGLWMPFAKISAVKGWEDFGFRFKEGDNETAWDDAHGIVTFRYTEPMTWWMRMPKDMPRTIEAALAEAKRLATEKKDPQAMALLTSGYHDEQGRFAARLLDTPWCDGAVWSMNSMPGIAGDVTDFKNKWGPSVREKLYGPGKKADLDGEYIDSSEGYVTDELDFRRDHFATAETPLTFSLKNHKPAIFRGLIVFEYIRGDGPGRARDEQADDGQLDADQPVLAGPAARRDGHGDRLEPRRHVAADVRQRAALPPGLVQGQALLLPDEHRVRAILARGGREVHETVPGLRHVPRLLQPQRLPGPLLHPPRTLRARPRPLQEVRPPVQARGRSRLGAAPPSEHGQQEHTHRAFRRPVPHDLQQQQPAAGSHDHGGNGHPGPHGGPGERTES